MPRSSGRVELGRRRGRQRTTSAPPPGRPAAASSPVGLGAQRRVPAQLLLRPQPGDGLADPRVEGPGALALLRAAAGRRSAPPPAAGPAAASCARAASPRRCRAARPGRTARRWVTHSWAAPSRSGAIQPSSLRVPSGKSSRLQPLASRSRREAAQPARAVPLDREGVEHQRGERRPPAGVEEVVRGRADRDPLRRAARGSEPRISGVSRWLVWLATKHHRAA